MLLLTCFILLIGGVLAWFMSTVAAGGAATLLIPLISLLISTDKVAPILTVASLCANPSRIALFWRDIHWPVLRFLTPGSMLGAVLGAYTLARINPALLQLALGIFLMSTVIQPRLSSWQTTISVRAPHFFGLGLLISFLSGLIGATGPILNPFLLRYGLVKEHLVATKSVNSFVMQLTKLVAYASFSLLTGDVLGFGLCVGIGAIVGVFLARKHLLAISPKRFVLYMHSLMFVSGVLLIGKALFF